MEDAAALSAAIGLANSENSTCASYDGSNENILSAAAAPAVGAGVLVVAFENGSGDDWRPAACSDYVQVNRAEWW